MSEVAHPGAKQSHVESVTQAQAQEPTDCQAFRRVRTLDPETDDPGRQRYRGSLASSGETAREWKDRVSSGGATPDQAVHVVGGKVEPVESFDPRADQDVVRSQRIAGLLKQEAQQAIGQNDGRVEVYGIRLPLGCIGHDDPLGPFGPSHGDRNVGCEATIGENSAVQRLGSEDERNGKACPNGLSQVAPRQDNGSPIGQIGGHRAKPDRQRVEVPPRE